MKNRNKVKTLALLFSIPALSFANEGQKMLGLINDIVISFGLCILLVLVFPFLIVIPNERWRFALFTIINISALIFLLLNFELDDFEIFNGYGIVIFLLVINGLYAWRHFRKSKVVEVQNEVAVKNEINEGE